jgi:hypothetical protein
VKSVWDKYLGAERFLVMEISRKADDSMEEEDFRTVKHWVDSCKRLALKLHQYNSTAAYKQSAVLIHKLYRVAATAPLGLFNISENNKQLLYIENKQICFSVDRNHKRFELKTGVGL